MGRFLTPDPYSASVGPADPGNWNRYAYRRGDPINRFDPAGLEDCTPLPDGSFDCGSATGTSTSGGYSGGSLGQTNPADPEWTKVDNGTTTTPAPQVVTGGNGGSSITISPSVANPNNVPPCADNPSLAAKALGDLVNAVWQVLTANGQLSSSQIGSVEQVSAGNESDPNNVTFQGGHFNLVLTQPELINDFTPFVQVF
jgi:hypothetical protein